jgi:hypothetical protein
MARSDLTDLLNSPDKGVTRTSNTPNGKLAELFRLIVSDMNIGLEQWGALMRSYVADPENGIAPNRKEQTSARGNLTAAFIKDSMTWKVLCKALRFFQVWKIDIAIRAYHRNGNITLHSTSMMLGAEVNTDDEHDDDDSPEDQTDRQPTHQTEFDFGKEGHDE